MARFTGGMMARALLIFDVAVAGIGRATQSLPRLLAIYWLPWLLGTVVLLILEVVTADQLRLGSAPAWARNIVWAPFAAMAYLMLLRWVVDDEPPARPINLDLGRRTLLAAPVAAAWLVADDAVSAAPVPMLIWLMIPADFLAYRWEDVAVYAHAFNLAAWVARVALLPCFFGLIVVVARCGWPDPRQHWRLLRLRPARLFCISLLATAAAGGAWVVGWSALEWLGVDKLRPPQGMIPWRANIHWALVAELAQFPLHFLDFAIQGSIMAEAYRRLLPAVQDEEERAATLA